MSRPVLVIGDKNYSSWSLRAWLLLKWLGVDFEERLIRLYREGSHAETLPYSPTCMVPALIDGDIRVWDTFGIILHMADRHPEVWPAEPHKRAFVQSICSEMHAGFKALRGAMFHNGRARNRKVPITPDVQSDIDRIETWIEEGCPRSYVEAYLHAKWRKRIHDEKCRFRAEYEKTAVQEREALIQGEDSTRRARR